MKNVMWMQQEKDVASASLLAAFRWADIMEMSPASKGCHPYFKPTGNGCSGKELVRTFRAETAPS